MLVIVMSVSVNQMLCIIIIIVSWVFLSASGFMFIAVWKTRVTGSSSKSLLHGNIFFTFVLFVMSLWELKKKQLTIYGELVFYLEIDWN